MPGEELHDAADRVSGNAVEDVAQVGLWIEAVALGRLDQRVDRCSPPAAGVRAGEEVVLPSQGDRTVILPMSGRTSRSTIVGTPCMADASDAFAASCAVPYPSFTLSRPLEC